LKLNSLPAEDGDGFDTVCAQICFRKCAKGPINLRATSDNPLTWITSHSMKHRESPPLPAGARRALRCLSLLLVPVLAPEAAPAMPRQRYAIGHGLGERGGDSLPYLVLVGTPPLRFQRSTPPPDLVARPASGAPPVPSLSSTESSVAWANLAAARSAAANARGEDEAPVTEIDPPVKNAAAPPPAKTPPRAILPDETRAKVRPEDFLPFFQVPGNPRQANEVNVIMPANALTSPAPGTLPPSTATYTQTPK
jgi:hypothetical protein